MKVARIIISDNELGMLYISDVFAEMTILHMAEWWTEVPELLKNHKSRCPLL